MDYENFKTKLLDGVKRFYGDNVKITVENVLKNNGYCYDGLRISKNESEKIVPIINISELYDEFKGGELTMGKCILKVCKLREDGECTEEMKTFAAHLTQWDFIKDKIYPVLISQEHNQELLQRLVYSTTMDMAIIYVVRAKEPGVGNATVKISRDLLEYYGIDKKQLHEIAMANLEKDGYSFQPIESVLRKQLYDAEVENDAIENELRKMGMCVLTNSVRMYGAAGIVSKELLRKVVGNKSFYIIPSSLHETIFMPAIKGIKPADLNKMIVEMNEGVLDEEEVLADHCYYYDGEGNEIRMCA